ncbi:MAG: elongation factor G [Myxococcota bacterium]|nr:elongation factor G [Myxococcota bacterium]
MSVDIKSFRNIGISAHIDSGKTTLTERILFYTNRIHAIHDVRGKDGVGAKMDSMDLERERGITIQSAATHCEWKDHHINIIDTPGHVDFTIEVERALRVLDGAILVLCSVAGVQSQSMTVDRQMRRYGVPRIAFVNKCDRQGANPIRVRDQLREKLKLNAQMVQLPIGLEDQHRGVVDLVSMKSLVFEGDNGEKIIEGEIPADMMEDVEVYREELLDAVSMFNDDVMEAMLEETLTEELLRNAIRECTVKMQICPVLLGSAYKNKGVQPALDAVVEYLPNPIDVDNNAVRIAEDKSEEDFVLPCDKNGPFVGLAFKLEDGRYGQLTYVRLYSGILKKGETIVNGRTQKKVKVGRLVRMHSDEMEDIDYAEAGDIVALFGVDCASGDTFTNGSAGIAMSSMHVPDAVVSVTLTPSDSKAQQNMSKALQRFTKEDPTFRVASDPETGETIVSGMGELHVDVYIERMKREYNAEVVVSPPRVSYREAISRRAEFNYTHKKQTGGSGQYGRVAGFLEPSETGEYVFDNKIKGGAIPTEFISAVDKGFQSMFDKGTLVGAPIEGCSITINDGQSHSVDSSDNAFQAAARGAFREAYAKAGPIVLEPMMRVVLEGPVEFHGQMVTTLVQRRGMVLGTTENAGFAEVEAEVPLGEMFGYATVLRSVTQGRAEFTMEFSKYAKAPNNVAEELKEAYRESLEA